MCNKNHVKEVAEIILNQLNSNLHEMWAWGATDYCYLEREVDGIKQPAFMFSIRTPKIKKGGRVIVSLNEGADTYVVEAIKIYKNKETLIGVVKDVYFDTLHSSINSLIEDKESFTQVFF